jgi:outer membrane protein OmpA-like peptidoglycan-associated protein
MKKTSITPIVVLVLLLSVNNMNAQTENNPWAINIGFNAIDYYPTAFDKATSNRDGLFAEYFNYTDHYNMANYPSSLSISRYLGKGLSVELDGAYNKITKVGNDPETNPNVNYLGFGANLKYALYEKSWFDPYIKLGGGYSMLDNNGFGALNGGIGAQLEFSDMFAVYLETAYKHSLDTAKSNPFFQHNLGLSIRFGGKDTDKDGVYDKDDKCPETFGLKKFDGCPDTDADGVKDSDDKCPEVAGPVEHNGCPDADGDGIVDVDDACPELVGTKQNKGCPDTDADGIVDKDDKCPKVEGPSQNNGCPWPDTDGDGILDKDDKCPKVAGLQEKNGCPFTKEEIAQQEKEKETARQNEEINRILTSVGYDNIIYFNSRSYRFKYGVIKELNAAMAIMNEYPTANFLIEGHADYEGTDEFNQTLSENRAEAVKQFFIKNGIDAARLSTAAYGETQPVADNTTASGRAKNRRVKISVK